MIVTLKQLADLVAHVDTCDTCGDEEIRAELHEIDERGFEPYEAIDLADLVSIAHSQEWQEFAADHLPPAR